MIDWNMDNKTFFVFIFSLFRYECMLKIKMRLLIKKPKTGIKTTKTVIIRNPEITRLFSSVLGKTLNFLFVNNPFVVIVRPKIAVQTTQKFTKRTP